MVLSKQRLRVLVRDDRQPLCRTNGCYRYAGMLSEGSGATGVSGLKTVRKRRKRGSRSGPLETVHVSYAEPTGCEPSGLNSEESG